MNDSLENLPIYPYLGKIADGLLSSPSRFLVLTAETGAGKSTAVPLALLSRVPGKIVMLEPRKIATIAIADRISSLLGEKTGGTAGYRIHLENRTSERTKIEIITEAILTRRIQNDPSLAGISAVILDEFHERSIHSDLALALLKEIVTLRDDLFVIVMSATIDTGRVAAYLSAPVMSIPGKRFPVEIEYAGNPAARTDLSVMEKTARAIGECLAAGQGNILAFLPGIYEIRKTAELLSDCPAEVLILHSSVPVAEQRKVLEWSGAADGGTGKRRVILSSSVAETSLTVPGVSVVIDSGLARNVKFNVATGMDRLVTEPESAFQAEQRSGRAGRTGPGRCVRLWARHDVRVADASPEITRSDIVPLVLECALWGTGEPDGLDWLDPPNGPSWRAARELLFEMEALDRDGKITARGRKLASLGVHPRIGAVALEGESALAARYADRGDNPRERERFRSDLEKRAGCGADRGRGAIALLAGFPDRIARHVGDGIYQFPSGRLASLPRDVRKGTARQSEWIVAPDVDSGEREGRIYAFEALETGAAEAWLERRAVSVASLVFTGGSASKSGKPVKKISKMYGKLFLSERLMEPDADDMKAAVCAAVRKDGFRSLPWSAEAESLLLRARFAARVEGGANGAGGTGSTGGAGGGPAPEDIGDEALLASLEDWLVPFLPSNGVLTEALFADALRWRFESLAINRNAPSRIELPNGLSRPLAYEESVPGEGPIPVLETRLQDLYGCPETPRVSGMPVLLRLLSPARRPVQITRDLAGFWKGTWNEVRKEMKGRYPKHEWPENPLLAPERMPKKQ